MFLFFHVMQEAHIVDSQYIVHYQKYTLVLSDCFNWKEASQALLLPALSSHKFPPYFNCRHFNEETSPNFEKSSDTVLVNSLFTACITGNLDGLTPISDYQILYLWLYDIFILFFNFILVWHRRAATIPQDNFNPLREVLFVTICHIH